MKRKNFFGDLIFLAVLFILAVVLRAIPEIKAGIWPIGYDTFNTYAAELASYQGPLINWLKTANILYFLFLPLKFFGLSSELAVKILGPILYGALAVSFYYFSKISLKFSPLKSFLVGLFFIIQLAGLRLSWDLYRNELALIFLFWGLNFLPKNGQSLKAKDLALLVLFSVLVVLSNQLVTVLLLVVLSVYFFFYLSQKKWEEMVATTIVILVVAMLFAIVIRSSGQVLYNDHVLFISEKNYFWRYFYHYNLEMSYSLLRQVIGSLFWLLYGPLLAPAILGWWFLRKNLILQVFVWWLLLGTFSALLFFGNGLMVWERWLFMLVFPLAIFSIEGCYRLGGWLSRPWGWAKKVPQLAFVLAMIFWLTLLGLFMYRAWPFIIANYSDAKPPLANDELNHYFPRTMVHNSLGIGLLGDTLKVVSWLDKNAPPGSVILVDNRYRGVMLTNFNIDDRYIITNPWSENIQGSTLEEAKKTNFWPIYLIWNTSKSIDGFDRIYNVGNRGVYRALPEFKQE